ncbi:MAG: hypothetical protein IAE97_02700 [Chthoniobacterales bacterium]|nr:hypothetical protein [Chthoniobacterales bacterium]
MLDSLVNPIIRHDWSILLATGILLLGAAEIGYRIGRRHTPERRKTHQPQSGALQGALLGLLGLLLGFTFAMAVARYDARKQLVLDEANAIGTAWLRAAFLGDQAENTIRTALMDYIDARLEGADATFDSSRFSEQAARSERDQAAMWRTTVAEVKARDTPSASLFTAALNDLIDLDSKRQGAMRNHIPATVWLLLMLVAATVCGTTGYATALGESGRHTLSMVILPALLAVVITIVADLDNPHRGLIHVSQQGMRDLKETLQKYK